MIIYGNNNIINSIQHIYLHPLRDITTNNEDEVSIINEHLMELVKRSQLLSDNMRKILEIVNETQDWTQWFKQLKATKYITCFEFLLLVWGYAYNNNLPHTEQQLHTLFTVLINKKTKIYGTKFLIATYIIRYLRSNGNSTKEYLQLRKNTMKYIIKMIVKETNTSETDREIPNIIIDIFEKQQYNQIDKLVGYYDESFNQVNLSFYKPCLINLVREFHQFPKTSKIPYIPITPVVSCVSIGFFITSSINIKTVDKKQT